MPAFVEYLSIIVRQGPEANKFGDKFAFAVAGSSVDGKTMVLKALTEGKEPVSKQSVIDVVNAVKALGLDAHWERMRDMAKEQIKHVDEAKNTDGSINHETVAEHAAHAMAQIQDGHYQIIDAGQEDLGNGETKIWFIRKEV